MMRHKMIYLIIFIVLLLVGLSSIALFQSNVNHPLYESPIEIVGQTYYVSQEMGQDDFPGTQEQPFATISKAAGILEAGDVCYIKKGIYRETVTFKNKGKEGAPILLMAYQGDEVVVSGTEVIEEEWRLYKDQIYRVPLDIDLGIGKNQVFLNGQVLIEARHPNEDIRSKSVIRYSPLFPTRGYFQVDSTFKNKITSPHVEDYGENEWQNGLYVGGHNAAWTWQSAIIQKSTPGALTVKKQTQTWWFPINGHYSAEMSEGYITNHMSALDTFGEWYMSDGWLYLLPPKKTDLTSAIIEVKERQVAFDMKGSEYIYLYGLNVHGATVTMAESESCVLDHMKLSYTSHFQWFSDGRNGFIDGSKDGKFVTSPSSGEVGVYVSGHNNQIINSTIEYSAGAGIYLAGYGTIVKNNLIHDIGYGCTYLGGLYVTEDERMLSNDEVYPIGQHKITYNTIYNVGRSAIHFGSLGSKIAQIDACEIAYNEIANTMLFTSDGGAFYAYGVNLGANASRTSFHNNYLWNNFRKSGGGIIYSDNLVEGIDFENNVSWGHQAADHTMYTIKTDTKNTENKPINLGGNFNLGVLDLVANNLKKLRIEGFEYFEAGAGHGENPFKLESIEWPEVSPYKEPKDEISRKGWQATASTSFDEFTGPENAFDGDDLYTYWRIKSNAQGVDDWFVLDLGQEETFSRILLKSSDLNSPRSYAILVSSDGIKWSEPVAMGDSCTSLLDIHLYEEHKARYIKILQNEKTNPDWGQFWGIQDIRLFKK